MPAARLHELLERRLEQLYLSFKTIDERQQLSEKDGPTLASTPTKTNPAAPNWKTLHLFNGAFGIGFAYKLHKTTVFPNWHLDLQFKGTSTKRTWVQSRGTPT